MSAGCLLVQRQGSSPLLTLGAGELSKWVSDFDTQAGTIELAIPNSGPAANFPDWLVEPRRRAERALVAVVAQCYVEGVSTRRVDEVVRSMGIDGISKSQASELAKSLDETVSAFRNRPLDAGPYTYAWVDALTQKLREGHRRVVVADPRC